MAKVYESLETCPDDLLLFLHHVPYTYKLHSGKTVIQYIYDSHYEGAEAVAGWVRDWKSLTGRVDDQRYDEVLAQLEYQAAHAEVWRDAVNDWFHRTSGIDDAKNRVGHHPGRTEAEAMKLEGYTVRDITPWETASGGKAIACPDAKCTAALRYDGAPGWFTLHVQYFDLNDAVSRFKLWVGDSTGGRMELRPIACRRANSIPRPPLAASSPASPCGPATRSESKAFRKAANWPPSITSRFFPSPQSRKSARRTEESICPPLTPFVIDVYSLVAKLSASVRSFEVRLATS